MSDCARKWRQSIVLATVERRKRLSAENNHAEGSAIAVALQTVALAPPFPSEWPAQLSWINLGPPQNRCIQAYSFWGL
jgi:hypothetical protein